MVYSRLANVHMASVAKQLLTEIGKSSCPKLHPKRCKRFIKHGKNARYGCKRGNNCSFYHPKHCPSSLSDKSCFSAECTLVHQVGTKRRKPPDEQSYRRIDSDNRSGNQRRGDNFQATQRSSSGNRSRTSSESRQTPKSTKQSADFLELKSLLTSFQDKIQKEMEDLKSNIIQQESKISSFLPAISQHFLSQFIPVPHRPLSQNFMPHQFHPQSHLHPPPQMSWSNIQASGS